MSFLTQLAQSSFDAELYRSTYTSPEAAMLAGLDPTTLTVLAIVGLALIILIVAALWKIFQKANQPGWAAIVPIYNQYILLKIIGRPWWWLLIIIGASFIPVIGSVIVLVVSIILANDTAKSFGKGTGTTVLLVLLPFVGYPMLAWGDAKYQGPSALGGHAGGTPPVAPPTTPVAPTPPTSPTPPATPPTV